MKVPPNNEEFPVAEDLTVVREIHVRDGIFSSMPDKAVVIITMVGDQYSGRNQNAFTGLLTVEDSMQLLRVVRSRVSQIPTRLR